MNRTNSITSQTSKKQKKKTTSTLYEESPTGIAKISTGGGSHRRTKTSRAPVKQFNTITND